MKHSVLLACLLLIFLIASTLAEGISVDLSPLTTVELNSFLDDIDQTIKVYHQPSSAEKDTVLSLVEEKVESHFERKGIQISWAWLDYSYTKDWDFYTLKTHIDYEDGSGKYKPDVYAEIFPEDDELSIFYLSVGSEIIIDERTSLPETLWAELPQEEIDASNSVNIFQMDVTELNELKEKIKEEIKNNHEPNHKISEIVLSLTKSEVENYFIASGEDISCAWFDYAYTREWDFYTLTTPIDYGDVDDAIVYSEAYPVDGKYVLYYLSIDDDIILDRRENLPETFVVNIQETDREENKDNGFGIATAPPVETAAPISTPKATITPEPTATPTPKPTATPEPILMQKGSKGNDVKQLQDNLILLGYLNGAADGDFGSKTKAAVEAFQKAFSLEVSGIVDNDDMEVLLEAVRDFRKKRAQYWKDREKWIDSQFSFWDGSHNDLEKLIKDVLNDEKSYKHIETSYIDITDETKLAVVNETLSIVGNKNRAEIGDLLIIVEFSAKNAFNATIKNTAYGIASYANNTISLVAIE